MSLSGSSRFKRIKKPLNSDMNVVPYIDVMLVLLVIFMVTAPMISSSIKVDLPEASSTPFESKSTPAIVSINKDGAYFLNYEQYKDTQRISLPELKNALGKAQLAAKSEQKQLVVLIQGDKTRPYGDIVELMAQLQQAGLTQVGLMTESP